MNKQLTAKKVFVRHGYNFDTDFIPADLQWRELVERKKDIKHFTGKIIDIARDENRSLSDEEEVAVEVALDATKALQDEQDARDESGDRSPRIVAPKLSKRVKQHNPNEPQVFRSNERISDSESEELRLENYLCGIVTGDWSKYPAEQARALSTGGSSGGNLVPYEVFSSMFIDLARAQSCVLKAGAKTMVMPGGTVTFPRLATDSTPAWRAENASITESAPTFGQYTMSAKNFGVMAKASRELFEDGVAVRDRVVDALVSQMASQIDYYSLYGTGAAGQPLGLTNEADINVQEMGANGATPTNYDEILDTIYDVYGDNGVPNSAIYSSRTGKTLAKLKNGDSEQMKAPEEWRNLNRFVTDQIVDTEEQGSSGAVCSSLFVGDFSKFYFLVRQGLLVELSTEAGDSFEKHQVFIKVTWRGEFFRTHPDHFAKLIGITA